MMPTPICSSSFAPLVASMDAMQRMSATPPPNDAFFHGRTGRVQRVFHAGFLSFISDSVAAPTLITATPPAKFANVPATSRDRNRSWSRRSGGGFDSRDPDFRGLAVAFNDRGVFLVHHDALARPRSSRPMLSSLMPRSSVMHFATGENCDVFEHRFAAITEAGRFHGANVDRAAELVHDEGSRALRLRLLRRMIKSGLPSLATFSRIGSRSLSELIFFS